MAVDPSGRRSGRGAYLCVDGACRATALEKGGLGRALEISLSDDVRAYLAGDPPAHDQMIETRGGTHGQE
ncbi:MAG: YlxR family protein [Chloroflexi bacterium]|nr:YlxR family protein [Chloroflexota bacterium]